VADGRWSTGAAFGDYDGDGLVDLMVANYTEIPIYASPCLSSAVYLQIHGRRCAMRSTRLKGAGDSLFHNNGDGTFHRCLQESASMIRAGTMADRAVADFNNTGRPDIYVANDSMANFLYRNEGNGNSPR